MTFAWYAHLKDINHTHWFWAVLTSWSVAFFEYMLMIPANRIGYSTFSLGQLKVMQEVITLLVFVPFSIFYMNEQPRLDYLWAALCLAGAVYFVFRNSL